MAWMSAEKILQGVNDGAIKIEDLEYFDRMKAGKLEEKRMLKDLSEGRYDLSVLEELGCHPPFRFTATDMWVDVGGSDANVTDFVTGQIKSRFSKKWGVDLGLESVRFYKFLRQLILDGGRDLYVPLYNQDIVAEECGNMWIARRDWVESKTETDLYILDAVGTDDLKVIKATAAKRDAHEVFEMIKDRFEELGPVILDHLYLQGDNSFHLRELLGTDFDVNCNIDKGTDRNGNPIQKCAVSPIGEKKWARYAKAICYLPPERYYDTGDCVTLKPIRN